MSAMIVKGKIVGKVVKNIRPKSGKEPFDVATYFIVNGDGGKPVEMKSYDCSRKAGQSIECPVYVRPWRSENSYGASIHEIQEKNKKESVL